MKQEISSLDLHFLVQEFKVLETGKIDKIYQWKKDEFIFRVYTKEGKKHLRIKLPSLIFFTDKSYSAPTKPPGYCEFLRKYLTNTLIKKIEQRAFERILLIEFETKEEKLILIIELLKPGNVVLCKEDMTIMSPLERQRFKDRSIQPKQKYVFPPQQFDTKDLSEKDIEEHLKKSKKTIVKAIATELGFGGAYAEEILVRTKIDKNNYCPG